MSALPTSEQDWQATVVEAAERLGWRVYHTYDGRLATTSLTHVCSWPWQSKDGASSQCGPVPVLSDLDARSPATGGSPAG